MNTSNSDYTLDFVLPAGPTGPTGAEGATGAQGAKGVQGDQGPVGPMPTIVIGTVTTANPGTNPSITVTRP